jgi:hypothetical protein
MTTEKVPGGFIAIIMFVSQPIGQQFPLLRAPKN